MNGLIIRGGLIVTYFYETYETVLIREGDILIQNGFITRIGNVPDGDAEIMDAHDKVILPGFINAHTHLLTAALCKGLIEGHNLYGGEFGLNKPIMELTRVALSCLSQEEIESVLRLALMELISGGTTAFLDQCPVPLCESLINVAMETRVQVHVAPMSFIEARDGKSTQKSSSLDGSVELWKRYHTLNPAGVEIWLCLRALDMFDRAVVMDARDIANRTGMRITVDLEQTQNEAEEFRQRFGTSPINFLSDIGLLGSDVVLAHCSSVGEERPRLEALGVHVVNCVRAAIENGSVIPFFPRYSAIPNVAAGTDYHSPEMLNELRAIALVGKMNTVGVEWTKATDVFYAATIAAAKALGRKDIGRISEGYRADLVMINKKSIRLCPMTFPLMNIIYHGHSSDIDTVMINGNVVKQDGRLVGVDEQSIIEKAESGVWKCWNHGRKLGVI